MNSLFRKVLLSISVVAVVQSPVVSFAAPSLPEVQEQLAKARREFWQAGEDVLVAETLFVATMRDGLNIAPSLEALKESEAKAERALAECERLELAERKAHHEIIREARQAGDVGYDNPIVDTSAETKQQASELPDAVVYPASEESAMDKQQKEARLANKEAIQARFADQAKAKEQEIKSEKVARLHEKAVQRAADQLAEPENVNSLPINLGYKDRIKAQMASVWATLGNHRKKSAVVIVAVAAIGVLAGSDFGADLREQIGSLSAVQAVRTRFAKSETIRSVQNFVSTHKDTIKKAALITGGALVAAVSGKCAWPYIAKKA